MNLRTLVSVAFAALLVGGCASSKWDEQRPLAPDGCQAMFGVVVPQSGAAGMVMDELDDCLRSSDDPRLVAALREMDRSGLDWLDARWLSAAYFNLPEITLPDQAALADWTPDFSLAMDIPHDFKTLGRAVRAEADGGKVEELVIAGLPALRIVDPPSKFIVLKELYFVSLDETVLFVAPSKARVEQLVDLYCNGGRENAAFAGFRFDHGEFLQWAVADFGKRIPMSSDPSRTKNRLVQSLLSANGLLGKLGLCQFALRTTDECPLEGVASFATDSDARAQMLAGFLNLSLLAVSLKAAEAPNDERLKLLKTCLESTNVKNVGQTVFVNMPFSEEVIVDVFERLERKLAL